METLISMDRDLSKFRTYLKDVQDVRLYTFTTHLHLAKCNTQKALCAQVNATFSPWLKSSLLRMETWRDTLSNDISVSAMSVMVFFLSTPETREGLLNHRVQVSSSFTQQKSLLLPISNILGINFDIKGNCNSFCDL